MSALTLRRNTGGLMFVAAFAAVCGMAWATIQRAPALSSSRPAPMTPASTSVEGSIAEIMGSPTAPFGVAIAIEDGTSTWLAVDPLETVVLQGGRVTQFSNLERGQRVKALYAMKEGKEVARSIEITDPLPIPAPSDKPSQTAPGKPLTEY